MKRILEKEQNKTMASFVQKVYEIVDEIPSGKVATYGQIAFLAGLPQCSRRVGQALSGVPAGMNLPCHRVVNHQGRTVPGWPEQVRLLQAEGVAFRPNGLVDLEAHLWKPR